MKTDEMKIYSVEPESGIKGLFSQIKENNIARWIFDIAALSLTGYCFGVIGAYFVAALAYFFGAVGVFIYIAFRTEDSFKLFLFKAVYYSTTIILFGWVAIIAILIYLMRSKGNFYTKEGDHNSEINRMNLALKSKFRTNVHPLLLLTLLFVLDIIPFIIFNDYLVQSVSLETCIYLRILSLVFWGFVWFFLCFIPIKNTASSDNQDDVNDEPSKKWSVIFGGLMAFDALLSFCIKLTFLGLFACFIYWLFFK